MPTLRSDNRAGEDDRDVVGIARHVAIIMDGNGRWAKARALPRTAGHKAGVDAAKRAIRAAASLGVEYLTLFGFSAENWSRPREEIGALMGLLRAFLRSEIARFHEERACLRFIGDRSLLDRDIIDLIERAEALTENNDGITVIIALSYGGRQEIAAAVRDIARRVAEKQIEPDRIDEDVVSDALWTGGIPDPDVVIRTSGEKRVSNFLLWQSAYAEFVFLDTLWPDFSAKHLAQALEEFGRRERRFGSLTERGVR